MRQHGSLYNLWVVLHIAEMFFLNDIRCVFDDRANSDEIVEDKNHQDLVLFEIR